MAENLQPAKVIAQLFGISARRVEQLTQDGVITGTGRPRRYDLFPTIQSYIKFLSDKAYGREEKKSVAELEQQRLKADADWKESKAKITALQLAELEGRMHRSEDVEAITRDLVFAVRGMILALPGRCAMDVAQAGSAMEASAIIRRECAAILDELTAYDYDAEAYRRRVREREGWADPVEDEGGGPDG